MNSNIVTGILRAVVPGLVGYLVGKGLVPAGDAADLGAAIITIGAAVWSVSTNLESKTTAKPTVATGGPSNMNASIKGAIALFFAATALLAFSPARAADVAGKATPVPFVPCSQATGCYGSYVGGVIAGNNQSSNLLAGGLNSITTGEQNLGVDGGYLWANGTWMFGADVSVSGTLNGSPIAAGYSAPKWLGTQTFELGGSLASMFGGIKAADTTGLNAQILANIITPFVEVGAIERSWGAGAVYGGGVLFAIDNQHWFGKIDYLHGTFSSVSCSPIQTCNSIDLVRASVNYKF